MEEMSALIEWITINGRLPERSLIDDVENTHYRVLVKAIHNKKISSFHEKANLEQISLAIQEALNHINDNVSNEHEKEIIDRYLQAHYSILNPLEDKSPSQVSENITIDNLLDKINESGFDSLTPSEKDLLKKLSSEE